MKYETKYLLKHVGGLILEGAAIAGIAGGVKYSAYPIIFFSGVAYAWGRTLRDSALEDKMLENQKKLVDKLNKK